MDKSLVIGGVVTTLVVFSAHKILQRIRFRQKMFNIISEMDAMEEEELTKRDPRSVTSTLNS